MRPPHATIALLEDLIARPRSRPQVIFCDWHGVLCRKPFWHSITEDSDHPAYAILTRELDRLFTPGNSEGRDWMCGALSSRTILTALSAHHPQLDTDQLLAQLLADFSDLTADQQLLAALRRAQSSATIVLATDNIAEFTTAFRTAMHHSGERPTVGLGRTVAVFDDIISSSDSGVLKSENPTAFFGPWLAGACMTFADAVLIDDRTDNCTAFEDHGGSAILWTAK